MRLKVARTVVRVLQHDGDFAAAFLSFRSSLQTFAERAMLRTANAHKKVLDQIDQAAERQSYMHVMCCTMEPQALSHLVSQLPVCSSGVRALLPLGSSHWRRRTPPGTRSV
jgi:hypothetical protein